MRKRSPGMKTRSKTAGAPPASYETRSDSKAGSPARQPRSRAPRRPSRTAGTVSLARGMTRPSLNSRTWGSGGGARSGRNTPAPRGRGGADPLVGQRRREERALQTHRMRVDQPEPLEYEHAGSAGEAQRLGDAPVRRREPRAEQPRRDVLALGREIAGEAAELEDVV